MEMAISQFGIIGNRQTDFFRFTGESLYNMGTLPSVLLWDETREAIDDVSTGIIVLNGYGGLACTKVVHFVQSWDLEVEFVLTGKGRLEMIEQVLYYPPSGTERTVTALVDREASVDAERVEISFKVGDTITMLGTDTKEYIIISADGGKTKGWMRVMPGYEYTIGETYFKGTVIYD